MTPPVSTIIENARQQLDHPLWFGEDLGDTYSLIEAQRRRIAELESLATKDELTGLSNRRGLNAAVLLESERILRGQSSGAMLLMIDLNDFKAINDTFGHEAGDNALRAVSNTLLGFIRTTDHAARIGGDEFVLLLTHTTPSQMMRRLQVLDQAINELVIDCQGRMVSLSAAIGIAPLTGSDSIDSLFTEADQAMYSAKATMKRAEKRTKTSISRQRFVPPSPSSTSTSSERITA